MCASIPIRFSTIRGVTAWYPIRFGRQSGMAQSGMSARQREKAEASPESIVDEYLRNFAAYGNVILGSRFAEDALAIAVSRGVRQYVLVGAGFDSFALRRPSFAHEVAVYEVDHPATQGLKLRRRSCPCPRLPDVAQRDFRPW
jgi:O-methyltransferase involved in polyketide biosynthesis